MFDAKNERTEEKEKQNGKIANYGSLVMGPEGKMGFEQQVSSSVTGFLTRTFGQAMTDGIETYMNKVGTSLYDICQDSETVSEQLKTLFGTATDFLVDSMLKEAFAAQGVENNESYTRFDLGNGIQKLKELTNAEHANRRRSLIMKSELADATLKLSLFQQKVIKSPDGKNATEVFTFVPVSIAYKSNTGMIVKEIINSAIVESTISYIEQITDSRTVQALESHLNDCGTSLTKLCHEPEKVSEAIHDIFGDGAQAVIDAIIMVAYRTLGLKCCESVKGGHRHDNLAQALLYLRKLALEANR